MKKEIKINLIGSKIEKPLAVKKEHLDVFKENVKLLV